jgi:hypothetical protein
MRCHVSTFSAMGYTRPPPHLGGLGWERCCLCAFEYIGPVQLNLDQTVRLGPGGGDADHKPSCNLAEPDPPLHGGLRTEEIEPRRLAAMSEQ